MDNRTCDTLGSSFSSPGSCVHPYVHQPLVPPGRLRYGGSGFWRLVIQRPLWIQWLLQQGYSVLQCDVDVVWLHNPLPYFQSEVRTDVFVQSEQRYGVNCGFYFMRPSNGSISLINAWLADMVGPTAYHMKNGGAMHEQHSLVRIIGNENSRTRRAWWQRGVHVRRLPDEQFPNGKIWYERRGLTNKSAAFIVHSNWIKTTKKLRLRRDNLWFLDDTDTQCAAGFDPLYAQCNTLCLPATSCITGKPCAYNTNCSALQDRVRRAQNGLHRGRNWHPMALAYICGEAENIVR